MPVTLPPWSYTHLDTFDNCPRQYRARYIEKIPTETTKEMLDGRKVHDALDRRVAANCPLPPDMQKYDPLCESIITSARSVNGEIRTEMKVAINRQFQPCDFFAKDVYGRGALDVSILAPPNMFIGDWKTGKTREKDFQVKVFAFFGFIHYPMVNKIKAFNIWLPTLKPGEPYSFTRDHLPNIWSTIYMKLAAMEQAAAQDNFPPRKSPLCGYCPVKTCEHNPNKGA